MSKIDRYSNVNVEMKGTVLIVSMETDPAKVDIQPSGTGKTFVVATSGGAIPVPDTSLKLNLTLYKK